MSKFKEAIEEVLDRHSNTFKALRQAELKEDALANNRLMVYYNTILDAMGIYDPIAYDPSGQFEEVINIDSGKMFYTNYLDFMKDWEYIGDL